MSLDRRASPYRGQFELVLTAFERRLEHLARDAEYAASLPHVHVPAVPPSRSTTPVAPARGEVLAVVAVARVFGREARRCGVPESRMVALLRESVIASRAEVHLTDVGELAVREAVEGYRDPS